ncbi:MAG: ATP-binding cassette domain-containing protein [Oscillochloridaceae bacterium umkhey_bin13]
MSAITTSGLSRQFDTHHAVDDLTLNIPTGAVFGFLGPNGAGKTTTVRMLCALIGPTSGTASVAGYELGRANAQIRRSVGILTETPGLYEALDAMQNLTFFGRLYGLSASAAQSQAERYLRLLELWGRHNEPVGGFSKGMRQKLAIARALLHDPAVVFLDEPTSGLDPAAARTVRDFIKALRAEGRTIFLTTHNLTEAEELCDQIAIFRVRLLRLDTPDNLRAEHAGRGVRIQFADDPQRWQAIAADLPFVQAVSLDDPALIIQLHDPEYDNPALIQALVTAGAPIRYVEPLTVSLEQIYLQLVGHTAAALTDEVQHYG